MTLICLLLLGQTVFTSPESLAPRPLLKFPGPGIQDVTPQVTLCLLFPISLDCTVILQLAFLSKLYAVNCFLQSQSSCKKTHLTVEGSEVVK